MLKLAHCAQAIELKIKFMVLLVEIQACGKNYFYSELYVFLNANGFPLCKEIIIIIIIIK